MSENKKIILVQPDAALAKRAVGVLESTGWETKTFYDVKKAFGALNNDYDAFVPAVGTQWFDAVTLLKAVAVVNPGAKRIAWMAEPMEKVQDELENAGISVIFNADELSTIDSVSLPEGTVRAVPESGVTGYILVKAVDGMHAPAIFNALRAEGTGIWALKDKNRHMIVRVNGKNKAEADARLDALSKTQGIENTDRLLNTVDLGDLDTALLNARRASIKPVSFAFAMVDLSDDENAATTMALCPGVTAIAIDNKRALVQLAGGSLSMIRETVSQGIYALPSVLGVELFAGLNILEVE